MDIPHSDNIHNLPVPNIEAMREHLEHLFGNIPDHLKDGRVELAWTHNIKDKYGKYALRWAQLYPLDQLEELVQHAARINKNEFQCVYVGAALRKPGTFPGARTDHNDFYALPCEYVDLDDEGSVAKARLLYADAKPTLAVVTGRQPHTRGQCWWRLDQPLTDPVRAKAVLRGICARLGGDASVCDVSRVMRLAGSIAWNIKEEADRIVEVTYIAPLKEPGRASYTAAYLAEVFPPLTTVDAAKVTADAGVWDKSILGLNDKLDDGRDEYIKNTLVAVLIQLIGETGSVPSPQELYEVAWPQYLDHARIVNSEGRVKGEAYVAGKCEYTVQRFLAGEISTVPTLEVAMQSYLRKQAGLPKSKSYQAPGYEKLEPIEWLDMSNWDNVPVPLRKWAILDRVPLNQVGLFSGEGGTGKSIIELMKNVAHVTGKDWYGSLPERGGAFYLGAEDEAEEIHIRLASIAEYYGTTFRELTAGGLRVLPLLGQDSMLCVSVGRGNRIETTALYRRLYEAAGDLKPKNISIDTLSRAFGGDEINRVQVYAFAMHMQAIAKVAQGSVTILSHPSLAGMANGSGISGSTAWHGAFRFRQYLKGVKQEEDGDPADDDLRELEFKKNQYGPRGRPIILRYQNGLFIPITGASDPERLVREGRADGCFVNLLRKYVSRGDDVSHKPKSHYFAPRLFTDETAAKELKLRKSDFEDAMRRLMDSGRVLVEVFRKGDRSQSRLILSPGT